MVGNAPKVKLLASYWTLAGDVDPTGAEGPDYSPVPFRERVEAISKVGFTGMGLWHTDLYHTLETLSLADMKRILDDNGIVHVELEFLFDWFHPDGSARKAASDEEKVKLLAAAEALDARHLKVGDFFNQEVGMDQVVRGFAALCADAVDAGTNILFEVMPFAMIDNFTDALEMCRLADAPNGGLMIDTWHIVKMRTPWSELAAAPKRFILGVELNDGHIDTPEGMDLQTETTQHRAFPGQGEFDLAGFIDAVTATGFDGPYGVEVIQAENRGRTVAELAEIAYRTAIAQFT
ncbi:MAG TPA: sugar phosphate isomerase/epimerase [Woeseiaceae bacterium]|nr:sugar phosphate isomerase/epimerase [Woeseiaceae bacterium]